MAKPPTPPPSPGLENPDSQAAEAKLAPAERELLDRVSARIDSGRFELPHLPATSMALLRLTRKRGVDIERLVELIHSDPVLASELLRTANSVLYATTMPAETLEAAVMRIGLDGLRTLVLSVSVKSTVLRLGELESFSQEVWRQAFSVARIARAIGPQVRIEKDRAFLMGLLHDIGKIALLAMLAREQRAGEKVGPALVGRVFYVHHERAGALLCERWKLDEELISVAGNHHRFLTNEAHGRGAALVSLAHKLDLHLGTGDEVSLRVLLGAPELDALGLDPEGRESLLDRARRAFHEGQAEAAATAA